jgi:hypothetical protein
VFTRQVRSVEWWSDGCIQDFTFRTEDGTAVSSQWLMREATNHKAFETIAMISGEPRAIAKSSGVM